MTDTSMQVKRTVFLPKGSPAIYRVNNIRGDVRNPQITSSGGKTLCRGDADILLEYLALEDSNDIKRSIWEGDNEPPLTKPWQAMVTLPFEALGDLELDCPPLCQLKITNLEGQIVAARALELEFNLLIIPSKGCLDNQGASEKTMKEDDFIKEEYTGSSKSQPPSQEDPVNANPELRPQAYTLDKNMSLPIQRVGKPETIRSEPVMEKLEAAEPVALELETTLAEPVGIELEAIPADPVSGELEPAPVETVVKKFEITLAEPVITELEAEEVMAHLSAPDSNKQEKVLHESKEQQLKKAQPRREAPLFPKAEPEEKPLKRALEKPIEEKAAPKIEQKEAPPEIIPEKKPEEVRPLNKVKDKVFDIVKDIVIDKLEEKITEKVEDKKEEKLLKKEFEKALPPVETIPEPVEEIRIEIEIEKKEEVKEKLIAIPENECPDISPKAEEECEEKRSFVRDNRIVRKDDCDDNPPVPPKEPLRGFPSAPHNSSDIQPPGSHKFRYCRVLPGENLEDVAYRAGVSPALLASKNKALLDKHMGQLREGMFLIIP